MLAGKAQERTCKTFPKKIIIIIVNREARFYFDNLIVFIPIRQPIR